MNRRPSPYFYLLFRALYPTLFILSGHPANLALSFHPYCINNYGHNIAKTQILAPV